MVAPWNRMPVWDAMHRGLVTMVRAPRLRRRLLCFVCIGSTQSWLPKKVARSGSCPTPTCSR